MAQETTESKPAKKQNTNTYHNVGGFRMTEITIKRWKIKWK